MSVDIRCPSCSKRGKIEVSQDSLKNVTRGLLAVNVSKGLVCDHSFIAYIDKNLQVRDYFMADFHLELPVIAEVKEDAKKKIPPKEQLDIDIIKLNITPSLLTYLIKMIFLKKNPVILIDEAFIKQNLQAFYKFITENSFDYNFTYMNEEEYKKQKKDLKERIVFKGKEIVNDKENIVDLKKSHVEQSMIQKFFAELDASTSLIIIKNEIQKFYELAKNLMGFIEQTENKDTLNSKKMIDFLSKEYQEKFSVKILDFLLEIIENYFGMEVPKKSNVSDFLGFL